MAAPYSAVLMVALYIPVGSLFGVTHIINNLNMG